MAGATLFESACLERIGELRTRFLIFSLNTIQRNRGVLLFPADVFMDCCRIKICSAE